jgi:AcrR family transcriptional regulator
MTVNTQNRTRARHQRILDAALQVFSARGYHDAAVDDIAARAETSKGGVYFHFPGKQALFLALLDRTANLLLDRIVSRMETESDPMAKIDGALQAVIGTFSAQRSIARLFLVEALGAGPEFHARMHAIHESFAAFIKSNLDEAVRLGVISPLDTQTASLAWFGALNQVVTHWVLSDDSGKLEDTYPALRDLLLRSVGLTLQPCSEASCNNG